MVGLVSAHASDSKENLYGSSSSRPTGGNWKKSPTRTTWIPPNGSEERLTARQTVSIRLRVLPSSIDISSMIRTPAFLSLAEARRKEITRPKSAGESSFLIPISLQERIVI